jgi:hypothetical protein
LGCVCADDRSPVGDRRGVLRARPRARTRTPNANNCSIRGAV